MPEGAALMAVSDGTDDPAFLPARATKNPAGGWDLALSLPKQDKTLARVGRAKVMSLFTTGHTMAVTMDKDARSQWNAFLSRCNA